MKKITLLVLLVSLLMPMTMNATVTKANINMNVATVTASKDKANPLARVATSIPTNSSYKLKAVSIKDTEIPEGMAAVTLEAGDVWGDGSGYQMLLDKDATAYGSLFEATGAMTTATEEVYANFEYKIPENADPDLSTSNIVISNSITIMIEAGVYDWCITNPTPGDRMWIASGNGNIGGRADDFEFEAGKSYVFIVSLGGSNDRVDLNPADVPTDVEAEPTATTAEISWTPGEKYNASWDLRYRPYVDPHAASMLWDFPIDSYQEQMADWAMFNAGEGEGWGLYYANADQTYVCFGSASYDSNGSYTPDAWLFTPEIGLGGKLRFKAWNYSGNYPDNLGIFICTNPDFQSVDEFVQLGSDFEPAEADYIDDAETYEFDLSAYEGTGVIAFRHYNCTDQFRLYVGNIEVIPANAVPIPDWIVKENVTNPYVIEGLTPETEYEVQVMAKNEFDMGSDWTKSTNFVTLAAEQFAPLYILGEVNGKTWAANDGVPMTTTDGQVYTANITIDKSSNGIRPMVDDVDGINYGYFSFTTELAENNDEGGWAYIAPYRIGAVSEANADNPRADFRVYKYMFGQELSLTEGDHAFQLEEGTYNLEVDLENMKLVIEGQTKTAITDINVDRKADNSWYNLAGQKLSGKPSAAGIYINNGKKVVIK